MKGQTLIERHQAAAEIGLEHFRDSFLLAFEAATDGMAEQRKREARKVIRFFESETSPGVWTRLSMIPDPDTGGTLAESWIAQWEQLAAAVGAKGAETAEPKRTETGQAYR